MQDLQHPPPDFQPLGAEPGGHWGTEGFPWGDSEPCPTLSTTQAIGLFTTVGQSRLRGSPGAAPSAFPSASHGADAAWGKSAPGPCPATLSPFPSKPEESPF